MWFQDICHDIEWTVVLLFLRSFSMESEGEASIWKRCEFWKVYILNLQTPPHGDFVSPPPAIRELSTTSNQGDGLSVFFFTFHFYLVLSLLSSQK